MKLFNLLEIQYSKFTNSIKNYLAKNLNNGSVSYGNSSIFGQIINVLEASVQNIMLYIEDALVEQNVYTAQRKKSIYGLAAISGYKPSLGKASSVQLKMNFIPNNINKLNVVIHNKEELINSQNGLVYNIILPQESIILSIDNDNSPRYLYAVQGKFEDQTFISTGGKYYTQNFKFPGNLDEDYLEVRVNNELWEYCESIYDMVPYGKQYTYKISLNGGIDLIFGNDVHGQSLKDSDLIKVTYLLHDGEYGNLDPNKTNHFVFKNKISNINDDEIDGNSVLNISFANSDPCISGTNSESVEHVKHMIGLNSRSLVLSSPDNYKQFISNFSFCGYNRTWSEKGSMIINSLILRNYKLLLNSGKDYFNLKKPDFLLTSTQKQSIISCVENSGNQLAGVKYNIIDPEICRYAAYIYIKLKSSEYNQQYVSNQIRELIGTFFSNVQNDLFIPKSDIIHLLKNNIEEIDGVDIYFLSENNELALQTKQYTENIYEYDHTTNSYKKYTNNIRLEEGQNPLLGLDVHGNICLNNEFQFPVLMGGWNFVNHITDSNEFQEITITDPLIIVYE